MGTAALLPGAEERSIPLNYQRGELYALDAIGDVPHLDTSGQLELGRYYITTLDCWIEFSLEGGKRIRVAPESTFCVHSETHFQLYMGNSVVNTPKSGNRLRLSSAKSSCTVTRGSLILEATSNLGLKMIPLDYEMTIENAEGLRRTLEPGQLIFLKPFGNEFGMTLDIFLMELVGTSELLHEFPEDFPSIRRIQKEAKLQQLMISGYADATVGDAHTRDEFLLNK